MAAPDAMVVCDGPVSDSPSLLFYIDREVYRVNASPTGEFASRERHIGSRLFLSPAGFAAHWASGRQTFFIVEEAQLDKWRESLPLTPVQQKPVARSGTRIVLANRPN